MSVKEYKIENGPRRGVTLYEVDGFNFDSKEAAKEFDGAPWPRQLETGRWVTSDRVQFPENQRERAVAREKNKGGGK